MKVFFKAALIFVIFIVKSQSCPIDNSDCSTAKCTVKMISCENDYLVTQIPSFKELESNNKWILLSIRYTNISRIYRASFQAFQNVTTITTVDLSDNKISFIEDDSFLSFSKTIKKLKLSNNQLLNFQFDATLAVRLEKLYLDNNYLQDFYVVETINQISLTSLYLNRNNLSVLPTSIKSLTSLTYLDLSFNSFHSLPPFSFSTLISLITLDLNGLNALSCINVETFTGLQNLVYLNLTAPSQTGLEPHICWFNSLISLKEFSYNTSLLLRNQSLQSYDYCNHTKSLCWINILNLRNVSVRNPFCTEINVDQKFCATRSVDECFNAKLISNINIKTSKLTETSSNSTSSIEVIVGSTLGAVGFVIILAIIIMIFYFKRNKKFCFKEKKSENSKTLEFDSNKNNPLFAEGGKENGEDDYLNNVGTLVNIMELSDSSLSKFENVSTDEYNKIVRFDSNVFVYNNGKDKSVTDDTMIISDSVDSHECDMIQTIYEIDDEEDQTELRHSLESKSNDTINSSVNTKL